MPFDLGNDPARRRPASGLIGEICIGTPHFIRRPPNRARQKMADPLLQDAVHRQSDCVLDPLSFEELVNAWIAEARISPEIDARDLSLVAFDNRNEHTLPTIGAVDVAGTKRAALQIAKLIEQKQRMVTGAAIVAVPDAHLLLAMGRAHARIHIEHDAARRTASMDYIDPLARKISKGGKVLFGGQPSRLKTAHLARRGRATMPSLTTDDPAHRRIVTQTFGVVDIFVSRKTAEYGLPQHPNESMAAIPAGARVGDHLTRHRSQPERVVKFAIGKQSGIRGHNGTTKLEHHTAVEIESENSILRFTRWVRHGRFFKSNIIC
jgi:hypothetical protein